MHAHSAQTVQPINPGTSMMKARVIDLSPEANLLSSTAFKRIQSFFQQESGIFIPGHKHQLIITRLRTHMLSLGFKDFDRYSSYLVESASHAERTQVVDLLTTNETYFFREPEHFTQLANAMLPKVKTRPLRVWCAAASSGEEPYSLAMVLNEKLGPTGWELTASDLSVRVLETAEQGLYRMQRLECMPPEYLKKYCRRGVGPYEGMFMVDSELRKRVNFVQHNLLDSAASLGQFDIIFVRNVMIYFDTDVKKQVLSNLYAQLRPGGWLVTSHSESLIGLDTPLKSVRPSIYRRTA
ncbi:chemotaxis protein methyltransferase [Cellvibrio zantedeschiae]|uniref:Chemotaxis protein methyltransferase n=1 Tax=Cellvibrio zantedeschiae TaxID=1237077 RepID=A0ABQ3BA64_9GAMM|nr:protein-glutamate O-methyltransferase CheR [Cellvibrio zantedeschiae]GGY87371.1 chemotaxis protein methyltransferase [Cellvibrio zantedeschiae]